MSVRKREICYFMHKLYKIKVPAWKKSEKMVSKSEISINIPLIGIVNDCISTFIFSIL
jgi:DTW domain-containing protein YfiP